VDNPAAWHPDPTDSHDHRWWDGNRWTEHVADAGVAAIDPLPDAPAREAGGTHGTHGTQELGTAGAGTGGDNASAHEATTSIDRPSQPTTSQPTTGAAAGAAGGTAAGGSGASGSSRSQQPVWGQESTPSAGTSDTSGPGRALPASGLAITALVLGLLAIPLLLLAGLGVLFGIAAIVCGFIATSQAKRGVAGGRGLAIGGIVSGFVSLLIAGLVLAAAITYGAGFIEQFEQCLQETGSQAECQERLQDQLMERFGSQA
jgi:hypothetical protein